MAARKISFKEPLILKTENNKLNEILLESPRQKDQIPIIQEALKKELEQIIDQKYFGMVLSETLLNADHCAVYEYDDFPDNFKGNVVFNTKVKKFGWGGFLGGANSFDISKLNHREITIMKLFKFDYEESSSTELKINGINIGPYSVFIPDIKFNDEERKSYDSYLPVISALVNEKEKVNFKEIIGYGDKKISIVWVGFTYGVESYTLNSLAQLIELDNSSEIKKVIGAQEELYDFFEKKKDDLLTICEISDKIRKNLGGYCETVTLMKKLNEKIEFNNNIYDYKIPKIRNNITNVARGYVHKDIKELNKVIDSLRPDFPKSFVEVVKTYGVKR